MPKAKDLSIHEQAALWWNRLCENPRDPELFAAYDEWVSEDIENFEASMAVQLMEGMLNWKASDPGIMKMRNDTLSRLVGDHKVAKKS